ncbi:ubiquitin carboxyl-terminal hydrolase 31-like isoform X2 [Patiria miniata]|uniref:ubiquitinyl hydrolase 1 n=1 Tax=Patiria miniata TaxID=46514 RepID=A0A914AVA7_PATMI|nr:ubiquitin carboxyl-terminal hydrolase 31-like isoform X2 [Patiria miniata]
MMSAVREYESAAPLADIECIQHGERVGYMSDDHPDDRHYAWRGDSTLPRSFKTGVGGDGSFAQGRGYDYEQEYWPQKTASLPRSVANGVNRTHNVRENFIAGGLRSHGLQQTLTGSRPNVVSYSDEHVVRQNMNNSPDRRGLNDNVRSLSPSSNTSSLSSPKQPSLGSHGSISPSNSLSPHKKKSHKPSFRAFGSLIQKMMRQIRNMDESKSPVDDTRSVHTNDDLDNQGVHLSPISSNPVRLNGKVPGLAGLRNHGNTCFMNAIVQCLSNTDMLAEYFVLEQYQQDMRRSKKNNKKFGTKGEVTEQLALLMKSVWSCQYLPQHTTEFKRIVSKYSGQFRGNDQHDAQEFLIWLLDKVHEDLNCAPKKKYKQVKNRHNKNDELLAAEMLANHMRRNNSFIHDLFQAQFRSSLTCPHCGRQSNTFDPFVCVSLPIPQRTTRVMAVAVVYMDREPRVVRVGVVMDVGATVADLRAEVARQCSVAVTRIVLTEVCFDGFYRSYHDNLPLSELRESDSVYAIETPHIAQALASNTQMQEYVHVHCNRPVREVVTMVILNQQGIGKTGRRFGHPIAIEVDRSITNQQLRVVILKKMGCSHVDQVLTKGPLLRVGVVTDAKGSRHFSTPDETRPLHNPVITRLLKATAEEGGPSHIKAVIEWEHDIRFTFSQRVLSIFIEEDESVQRQRLAHQQPVKASLADCMDLYTQEEKLGPDNAWSCPFCKKLQQGSKRLSLWSLPDILVIHLKRFKQLTTSRIKLNTLVEFPIHGLNMSQYIARRQQNAHAASLNALTGWSPWRHIHRRRTHHVTEHVYDLYAVCNHIGSMQGGHYTAFCRNPADNQWYNFDDAKVTPLAEDSLVTRNAYILFYHRRALSGTGSASSSSSSSTCSSGSDHWIYRIPAVRQQQQHQQQLGSSQEDVLSEASNDNSLSSGREGSGEGGKGGMRGERSQSLGRRNNSQDDLSDEDFGGFACQQRPFVRGVFASATLPRSLHQGIRYIDSDAESVMTESCV